MHPYYPLTKKTHVTITLNNAMGLVERLLDTFQCLSLNAETFERPLFCAKCSSMDSVQLTVNLWKTTTTTARHNNDMSVVVEVQRTAGDSIKAMQYTRTILEAATNRNKNYKTLPTELPISSTPPMQGIQMAERIIRLHSSPPSTTTTTTFAIHEPSWLEDLGILQSLLLLPGTRDDARLAALEQLLQWTNPVQSGLHVAATTSNCLFSPSSSSSENHASIRQALVSIMTNPSTTGNEEFHAYMALTVLVQAAQWTTVPSEAVVARLEECMIDSSLQQWLLLLLDTTTARGNPHTRTLSLQLASALHLPPLNWRSRYGHNALEGTQFLQTVQA